MPARSAERRLVSVLFADLVGFTTLSESRDAEDVREILTRYFDTCRTLIERYGGTVEKFIGDAVMAVWGAPVATEHDAERAVRAALDLVAAVSTLGEDVGAPDLAARAGVLTGEAAVTIGARSQGMVAGDLVNTASRVQSAASPGGVLVGEATRRASEQTIVYEEAGTFELKGKTDAVPLFRALRVVAGAAGSRRSVGLESPFVGRVRELRIIKDLFHGSAEDRRSHLVSIVAPAGSGKSRLVWEFYKYIDGLADDVRWHHGRCLAYGEGVAYWALAEMVRTRADIVEAQDPPTALVKLKRSVEESVPDAEERAWIEPRLAHLLGLEERTSRDRDDLFPAWQRFYQRLSEEMPTVLVFEDIHWADSALLDFVDYLMERSRGDRLFVVTLSRPELLDVRPTWGSATPNFTSIHLQPLNEDAMGAMLDGLVPGLPDELRARILEHAAGVPLYAMETIRMLLDRGVLERQGSIYRATAATVALEVPESLHGLIAARLDGLSARERIVVQDAAVLGKTFFANGVAELSGMSDDEVEPILSSLVRKEILTPQVDERSPERGQFGFLQDLVRKVAYDTLSKRERKTKHLAAATFIERTWSGDEADVAEVVAAHYLSAYEATPSDEDAGTIREQARARLVLAGERAASLAAPAQAQRYFERAAELTDAGHGRAELLERAGHMALISARYVEARERLEDAIELFSGDGDTRSLARVSARIAEADRFEGRLEEAVERMEESFAALADEEPDENLARLAAELGRQHFFLGEVDVAADRVEVALDVAEKLELWEIVSEAINTKGFAAIFRGRPEEATALHRHALSVALEHDHPGAALRAYFNLAETLVRRDRYRQALDEYDAGLLLARRVGYRFWESALVSELPYVLALSGRWDEAIATAPDLSDPEMVGTDVVGLLLALPEIFVNRGDVDSAEDLLPLFARYERSSDLQERAVYAAAQAIVLRARRRYREALAAGRVAFEAGQRIGMNHLMVKTGFVEATEAAIAADDRRTAAEFLERMERVRPGERMRFLTAQLRRLQARTAEDAHEAEERSEVAAQLFREIEAPFWLAVTLTERAERAVTEGEAGSVNPLLAEAEAVFRDLRAQPWLDRVAAMSVGQP